MQGPDIGEFNLLLSRCGEIFAKPPTDEIRRVYWDALKSYPLATIREHAEKHIATAKFFPKPYELRPQIPKGIEPAESKFPPLYSAPWWEERSKVLKQMSPRRPSRQSLDSLNDATFGFEATPELLAQAEACYERTWPAPMLDAPPAEWQNKFEQTEDAKP